MFVHNILGKKAFPFNCGVLDIVEITTHYFQSIEFAHVTLTIIFVVPLAKSL